MKDRTVLALVVVTLWLGAPASADKNPQRDVFFGEQHVHTSLSFDAFAFGTTLTGPEDFYRYALGEPTPHPGGYDVTIDRPLDWGAVTEHAEYMGVIQEASDPDSPLRKSSPWLSKALRASVDKDPLLAFKVLSAAIATEHRIDSLSAPEVVAPVWERIIAAADEFYQPGRFTTFPAYEWTSTPDSRNLHRNIFFLDSKKVPRVPFTPLDSKDPRDLWRWMDAQRAAGNEVLAISHNANLSNGWMFPTEVDHTGRPIDRAWAEARLRNEPLTELKQLKGQSETTPALSPNDEFASYEVFVWQLMGASGAPRDYGSYARQAYRDGLALRQARGFNPYRFGLVSGSDSHVSAVPYRQEGFFGVHGTADDTPEKRIDGAGLMGLDNLWVSPAGLSAVWAEENTRESIFAGMKRKETYSTSGVRIVLRFFGGWEYESRDLEDRSWVEKAYERGVAMGADLPVPKTGAPRFLIWAAKDPRSGNLDRIQVVKGWSQNGQSFEKIHDVVWAGERKPDPATGKLPAIGSTVNLSTGKYENSIGATELKVRWVDPDFDPGLDAFYYVRVLEIPTPRWSTLEAIELGRVPPSGRGFSPIVQERAWSSPIWYTPSDEARSKAPKGLRVEDLVRKGAVALDDGQLEKLTVGRSLRVRNTVSGQRFDVLYGRNGQRIVTPVDGAGTRSTFAVELMHGDSKSYEIRDGLLSTRIAGEAFEVRVYRVGDRYFAARSNELGYASYELEPSGG